MKQERFTIEQFHEMYPDSDRCLEEIFVNRYGKTKKCPNCKGRFKYYKLKGTKCYECQYCANKISPLVGTIFEKSSTPLKLWFYAIYLFSTSSHGISAKELQRQLGVTYKCAWRIAHQIRLLFKPSPKKLQGTVEIDEAYLGGGRLSEGKMKNKRGRGTMTKTPVLGMVQRNGSVVAIVVKDTKSRTLFPLIYRFVDQKCKIITDEYRTYDRLKKYGFKTHFRVNHSLRHYVVGELHTNTAEGYWSRLKRSIEGTHSSVSPRYLQHYVNEHSYKYNLRHSSQHPFLALISQVWKLA